MLLHALSEECPKVIINSDLKTLIPQINLNHIKDETSHRKNPAKSRCVLGCSSLSHHLFYII